MTQGDSATVNIDLGSWDVENLLGDINDDGEGLVDLEQGDLINGQACFLQGLGNGDSWSGGEVDGVNASIGMSCDQMVRYMRARTSQEGSDTHR